MVELTLITRALPVPRLRGSCLRRNDRDTDRRTRAGVQEERLVAGPYLERRRGHERERQRVGAVGRREILLAQLALALHPHLAGAGDVVAQGEELRGELLVVGQGDEAVVEQAAQLPEDLGAVVREARGVRRLPPELHAVNGRLQLAQAVDDAPSEAALVHEYRFRAEFARHERRLARDAHEVHAPERLERDDALPPARAEHRLVVAEPRDVHADVDGLLCVLLLGRRALAGGGVLMHGVLDGGAPHERVLQRVGELRVDGGDELGVVVAPLQRLVGDVVGVDQARGGGLLAGEVGRLVGGDAHVVVVVALRVVGLVERAGGGEGVAREERPGRVEADGGVEVGLPDGVCLVDDEEELRGVEAVDVVRVVRGEADGEPFGRDDVACPS